MVLMILSLMLALSIQLYTQSVAQSSLTASRRVSGMYNNAAEFALNAVRSQIEQDFIVSNDVLESSSDFDKSQVHFSGLLGSTIADPWEQRYGVDYKTHGVGIPPGLTTLSANRWSVSLNDGRMVIPVRVFIKNNQTDPSRSIIGSELTVSGQQVTITENTDIDGKIVLTAVAYGVVGSGTLENEPMAILTTIVAPDPDFSEQAYSRAMDNSGANDNSGMK